MLYQAKHLYDGDDRRRYKGLTMYQARVPNALHLQVQFRRTGPEAVAPAFSLRPAAPCPRGEAPALRSPHRFSCLPHLLDFLFRGGLSRTNK